MQFADGNIHLHCYGKTGPSEMAPQEEELERGDNQVGIVQHSRQSQPGMKFFNSPADGHRRIR